MALWSSGDNMNIDPNQNFRGDFLDSSIQDQARAVLRYLQYRDYPELKKHQEIANTDVIKDLSFARLAISIPEQHYEVVKMAFPEVACPDATERSLGWKEYMKHVLSKPYKINSKQKMM